MFDKFPDNSASLLISPPLSGKKELLYLYIKNWLKNNQPVIFVSTDKSPEEIKKDLVKNKIFYVQHGNNLRFVDCYSHQTENIIPDKEDIMRVAGPLALNEISIALSEIERSFLKENKIVHIVIFDSLSTVLMYSNPEMVARFIQILIAKIKKTGGSVIFTIEEGMHDEKTIVTIEHLMDVIINLKKVIKNQKSKGSFAVRNSQEFRANQKIFGNPRNAKPLLIEQDKILIKVRGMKGFERWAELK